MSEPFPPARRSRCAAGWVALGALALTALACGRGDRVVRRSAGPVDTAVAYSLPDSTRADSTIGADSTARPGPGTADSAPVESGLVLRADSAAGAVIFHRSGRCFTCHGQNGAGLDGLGSNLQDSTWASGSGSLAAIARIVREGIPPGGSTAPMPAFGAQLSADDVRQVAAYVYALSHPDSVVADTLPADTLPGKLRPADALAADSFAATIPADAHTVDALAPLANRFRSPRPGTSRRGAWRATARPGGLGSRRTRRGSARARSHS